MKKLLVALCFFLPMIASADDPALATNYCATLFASGFNGTYVRINATDHAWKLDNTHSMSTQSNITPVVAPWGSFLLRNDIDYYNGAGNLAYCNGGAGTCQLTPDNVWNDNGTGFVPGNAGIFTACDPVPSSPPNTNAMWFKMLLLITKPEKIFYV